MAGLIDQYLELEDAAAEAGKRAIEIADKLASGTKIYELPGATGMSQVQVVAGLLFASLGSNARPALGLKRGTPRPGSYETALSPMAIGKLLKTTREERYALSAGLLQAVDHWTASHEAAQEIEQGPAAKIGACWHAIAHRREPDAFNAGYWVRKAGVWPATANQQMINLASRYNISPDMKFFKGEQWQPDAFFDAVARGKGSGLEENLLLRLQRIEIMALLDATWRLIVT